MTMHRALRRMRAAIANQQRTSLRLVILSLISLMVVGCAGNQAREPDPRDPWEGFNRGMYAFNDTLDKAILHPIAKGYDKITPDVVKNRVSNVMDNLAYPVTVAGLLLEGEPGKAWLGLMRFLMNSTFGLGGLFDVAADNGMPAEEEDIGQAFAAWGWDDSRYLVVPFFGPTTVRDGIGSIGDYFSTGTTYLSKGTFTRRKHYSPVIVDTIRTRALYLINDKSINDAYDPYAFVRDAYLQHRDYLLRNGEAEFPDYDQLLEDDDDGGDSGQ